MIRHRSSALKRATVLQVSGDPSRPERMVTDLRHDAGGCRAPAHHHRLSPSDGVFFTRKRLAMNSVQNSFDFKGSALYGILSKKSRGANSCGRTLKP
jgi:hypothetical protein